jgi:hypothetical protein
MTQKPVSLKKENFWNRRLLAEPQYKIRASPRRHLLSTQGPYMANHLSLSYNKKRRFIEKKDNLHRDNAYADIKKAPRRGAFFMRTSRDLFIQLASWPQ